LDSFRPPTLHPKREAPYAGQPHFLDEYGRIRRFAGEAFSKKSWGCGSGPGTLEEFYTRLDSLTTIVLSNQYITGFCYTQLPDIEQEQNVICHYDRTPKFGMARILGIFMMNK
jgi:hypothetical protein